jgi:hypothetical protein
MRRTFSVLAFTALLASAAASFTVLPEGTHSAPAVTADATFLVPANDGYGVGDCLATGGECAQVVANAWCKAQGFARATGFSPVSPEDITGSIQTVSTQSRSQPFAITCTR